MDDRKGKKLREQQVELAGLLGKADDLHERMPRFLRWYSRFVFKVVQFGEERARQKARRTWDHD